jgi:hypothetical protein
MSIEYAGDGEVDPARLYHDIRDCHQRLAAVIDEMPNDADGEDSPAAAVIEEVFAFLGALTGELNDWCKHQFVEIEESLHERLWAFSREQAKKYEDRGIEAEALLRAVVNTVVDDALAKPIDLQGAVDRYYPRIGGRVLVSDGRAQKSDPTAGKSGRTAVAQRTDAPGADSDGEARDPGGPAWSGGRRPREKVIAGNGRKQRQPARR